MTPVQEYLEEYLQIAKFHHQYDEDAYENLWKRHKVLLDNSRENLKKCFKFLPEDQELSFHDATIEGNVKPNSDSNTFDLTIRMLCYQKLKNEPLMKYPYEEIDPVYIKFTFDNKYRTAFHKLAVKSSTLLSVVYDEEKLGIVFLNKNWKIKCFYAEGVDLSNNEAVEHKPKKKNKM